MLAVVGLGLSTAPLLRSQATKETQAAGSQPAPTAAEGTEDAAAEKAWKDLSKALRPPAQPEAWSERKPTDEERAEYRKKMGEAALAAADKAKDFYTRFPKHPRAEEARKREAQMLRTASQMGHATATDRLAALETERAADPRVSEDERVQLRARAIQRSAMDKQAEGQAAVIAALEKGARGLLQDFPHHRIPYQMLMTVASNSDGDQARKIAQDIRDNPRAPEEAKEAAAGLLRKLEAVGKPFVMKFTAVDGREVDLGKLRGKVVLIDFWATWCGPCVAELHNVKAAYEKLHPKGFEILGISFDEKKEALTEFVAREKLPWVQYFDGQGWQNKFGKQFGIDSIPTMWLVDKQGILRDQNARGGLAEKVETLLAEE